MEGETSIEGIAFYAPHEKALLDRKTAGEDNFFNRLENDGATIVIGREEFGLESPDDLLDALADAAIEAVIALSFAEQFRRDATQSDIVCVTMERADYDRFFEEADPEKGPTILRIDLELMRVMLLDEFDSPIESFPCDMPSRDREELLQPREMISRIRFLRAGFLFAVLGIAPFPKKVKGSSINRVTAISSVKPQSTHSPWNQAVTATEPLFFCGENQGRREIFHMRQCLRNMSIFERRA